MGMFSWSLDSNNVALGFHGLLRFQEIGISLSHQDKGIGHSVVGDVRYSGPWDMTCFKPIDNPFKDKRFDSITIVLDTQEEAISMANAMYNEPTITMDEWALLKVLLD
jgi:hypothetical protein